jgi:two-component system, OmpR family, response regulator ResD
VATGSAPGTGQPSSGRPRLLVVDDDPDMQLLLTAMLEEVGFEVAAVGDGPSALLAAEQTPPDLVLLDLTLPGMDGYSVLKQLRSNSDVPVVILSGRPTELDRVTALERGADDYVVKPGSTADLVARIRAVLRRARPGTERPTLAWGTLLIDTRARIVQVADREVPLTTLEFELLSFLARHPRLALSREELLRSVWRSDSAWQDAETVTEHVRRLRRKLEEAGLPDDPITTIRGYGYRFDPPRSTDPPGPPDPPVTTEPS